MDATQNLAISGKWAQGVDSRVLQEADKDLVKIPVKERPITIKKQIKSTVYWEKKKIPVPKSRMGHAWYTTMYQETYI